MTGAALGRSGNVAADPAERAREIALRILAGAPRSAAQLREALLAREVTEAAVDEVLARYREVGLIDDAGLARTIARTRHLERAQSRRAIAHELRRKGFGPDDVSSAVAQISDDDERAAAQALAQRRWNALGGVAREAKVRRVVSLLGRKGYPAGLAFELVRRLEHADIWEDREVNPAEEDVTS